MSRFCTGAEQQQEPPSYPPLPFPVNIVEDEAVTQAREQREEEAVSREMRGLAAQEGMNTATQAMNRATERMADYTFWSTVLVAVGTVMLGYTLYLTWQANNAAVASIAVTREIGGNQLRPWILPYSCEFGHAFNLMVNGTKHEKGMIFYVIGQNFGQSPATDVNMFTTYKAIDTGSATPTFSCTYEAGGKIVPSGGKFQSDYKVSRWRRNDRLD